MAGGKSRKSGGVSHQLINHLKYGNAQATGISESSVDKKKKGAKNEPKKRSSAGLGLVPESD